VSDRGSNPVGSVRSRFARPHSPDVVTFAGAHVTPVGSVVFSEGEYSLDISGYCITHPLLAVLIPPRFVTEDRFGWDLIPRATEESTDKNAHTIQ
jgi:hypothetical protein